MPGPFNPSSPTPYPALYLYALNNSFVPKHISLAPGQRVKIGRQTNAKTVPAERNGYFDSKVLSRQHAEVWEENGKILIKDVKSSNGTFINGERLSPEGVESEPFELKTDDIVEFGIDIVGEDNSEIQHHKVAARVVCIFSEQDAQAAARAEAQQAQQKPPSYVSVASQPNGTGSTAFNFSGGQNINGPPGAQRRPTLQQQGGLVGMGGMGGNVRPPGKSGLTFDHILSRLQGELQKSRETGAELQSLSGAMNEISDALGGNLPPNLPTYPAILPAVMPPQPPEINQPPPDSASTLNELQAQLHETQMSLASHVEKIRSLEGMLAEHEAIKREVSSMRDIMEERKREMDTLRGHRQSHQPLRHDRMDDDSREADGDFMSDDDDTRSINTIVPHELERVEEEDEEQLALATEEDESTQTQHDEEERRRRRDEVRPRTPEPTGLGMGLSEDDYEHEADDGHNKPSNSAPHVRRSPSPPLLPPSNPVSDELAQRLTTLERQLESALELSRSLQAQHTNAQSTISLLEAKVTTLETRVQEVQSQNDVTQQLVQSVEASHSSAASSASSSFAPDDERERESLTEMLNEWKKGVEGRWSGVQEEWNDERERLKRAKEEWEHRVRSVEDGYGSAIAKVESSLVSLASFQAQYPRGLGNGHAKMNGSGGLVTPPSPRSLSAESTRPRQRKKRASGSRGRTRSNSTSDRSNMPPHDDERELHLREQEQEQDGGSETSFPSSSARRRSPWATDDSDDSESASIEKGSIRGDTDSSPVQTMPFPITPESSVLHQPINHIGSISGAATDSRTKDPPKDLHHFNSLSTFVGIVVLGVATAAVVWRVKPEGAV